MTAEIQNPAAAVQLVHEFLQRDKSKGPKFVCVLPVEQTVVICGSKPPLAVRTALNVKDGMELVFTLQKESGCKIVYLESALILTLG
jgi:hypothetical protein